MVATSYQSYKLIWHVVGISVRRFIVYSLITMVTFKVFFDCDSTLGNKIGGVQMNE